MRGGRFKISWLCWPFLREIVSNDAAGTQHLYRRLDEDARTGAHGNVAEVLAAIARSRSSPLTGQLCEPSNLESLISRAVVPPPQAPSVQVCMVPCACLLTSTTRNVSLSMISGVNRLLH